MHSLALFGGTFDPIHNGHIQTSLRVQSCFQFDSYIFLPCKIPAIKPPSLASSQQRIDMLQLAIKTHPEFKLDLREINRDTPSYMYETLKSFREEYPMDSVTLILGYDAFISLPKWHQWEKIISLAHLLVIDRQAWSQEEMPEVLQQLVQKHLANAPRLSEPAGSICFFDAGHYEFSSTEIRAAIKQQSDITSKLPKEVSRYITEKELYQ